MERNFHLFKFGIILCRRIIQEYCIVFKGTVKYFLDGIVIVRDPNIDAGLISTWGKINIQYVRDGKFRERSVFLSKISKDQSVSSIAVIRDIVLNNSHVLVVCGNDITINMLRTIIKQDL